VDAMDGMLKQEGGVNKASLMGSEPKLTSPPPLEKGEDSDEPVWLVLTRALSAGSCFIDRPYCAASPQASHRACPALGLATKEIYTKDLRLVSPFSRTVRTDPYGASGNPPGTSRLEEHTSELQSRLHLVCRLLLEKKKHNTAPAQVSWSAAAPPRRSHRPPLGDLH